MILVLSQCCWQEINLFFLFSPSQICKEKICVCFFKVIWIILCACWLLLIVPHARWNLIHDLLTYTEILLRKMMGIVLQMQCFCFFLWMWVESREWATSEFTAQKTNQLPSIKNLATWDMHISSISQIFYLKRLFLGAKSNLLFPTNSILVMFHS